MANNSIQANLKPETVERVAKIANSRKTRGIDKMLNECLDNLQETQRSCGEETEAEVESESDVE
jgi:hypothetical protein